MAHLINLILRVLGTLTLLLATRAGAEHQADKLLDAARRACEEMPGVAYVLVEDHHAADGKWKIHCTARQARASEVQSIAFTEGIFRFEGSIEQDGKKDMFAVAYDGKKLYVLNPGEATVHVIDGPTTADLTSALDARLLMLGVPPLTADEPFENSADERKVVRAGEKIDKKEIGKTACDVLEVNISATAPDGSRHEIRSTWAFGQDDHLPRMRDSEFGHVELHDLRVLKPEEAADRSSFAVLDPPSTQPAKK